MSVFAARRCVQHPGREAVARCAECHGDFCRECIVEHDGRILCAGCLVELTARAESRRSGWQRPREWLVTALAGLLLWTAWYALGITLKAIPASFHEGTIWQARP